jgi:hypothetical protein
MWYSLQLFLSLSKRLSRVISRESLNLLQILFVGILFYRELSWGLEVLLLLLLVQLLSHEGNLVRKSVNRQLEKLAKEKVLAEREDAKKELKHNLESLDLKTLQKLVARENVAKGEALLEGEVWEPEKLNILEEVLKGK